jgi:hypothetical protein
MTTFNGPKSINKIILAFKYSSCPSGYHDGKMKSISKDIKTNRRQVFFIKGI